MLKFKSYSLRHLALIINVCFYVSLYAGGHTDAWHYINVRSCDSAKGLVYADTTSIKENPQFAESVDLKWVEEINGGNLWEEIVEIMPYGEAKPADGYVFTGWCKNELSSNCFSFDNPSWFVSEAKYQTCSTDNSSVNDFPTEPDDVFYACFGKVACAVDPDIRDYELGEVSTSNPLNETGETVVLTATPSTENVYFSKWIKDGKEFSKDNPLSVTAQDAPSTYYAVFNIKNISDYNFSIDGEWKYYYNPTLDAHVPTSAKGAYVMPDNVLSDSTYYLVRVDTLIAGNTYLIYGEGKGEIEYYMHDPMILPEVESSLIYATEDITLQSDHWDSYYILDPETMKFVYIGEEPCMINKDSGYLHLTRKANDIIEYSGIMPEVFDFHIESYYCIDYANNSEGFVKTPTRISMSYDKNEGFYNLSQFFEYKDPIIKAIISPSSLDDVQFSVYELSIAFFPNYLLSVSSFMIDEDTYADVWYRNYDENGVLYHDSELDDLFIKQSGDKYEMTPFYIISNLKLKGDDFSGTGIKYIDRINISRTDNTGLEDVFISPISINYKISNGCILFDDIVDSYVYNTNGILVKHTMGTSITDLAKGFYIIRIGQSVIKVVI